MDNERLEKDIERHIKTVMVGSLAIVEKELGHLWAHGDDRELSEQEQFYRLIYELVRKEMFDNGNRVINLTKNTLKQYEVKSKRFKLTLPVKN